MPEAVWEQQLRGLLAAEPLEDVFEIGQSLGRGGFAYVRLGTHKATSQKCALKFIEKTNRQALKDVVRECAVLRKTQWHMNVLEFVGLYETRGGMECVIVTEYVAGGSLYDALARCKHQEYSEAEVCVILRQVLAALAHCHARGIVHCDLKEENILCVDKHDISSRRALENNHLKLSDFGLALQIELGHSSEGVVEGGGGGTPQFMAPERLADEPFDHSADVWAVGVLFCSLLCGNLPYTGRNEFEVLARIQKRTGPPQLGGISSAAQQLLDTMLALSPKDRPTAQALLLHPWVNGHVRETAQLKNTLKLLRRRSVLGKLKATVHALRAQNMLKTVTETCRTDQAVIEECLSHGVTVADLRSLSAACKKAAGGREVVEYDSLVEVLQGLGFSQDRALRLCSGFLLKASPGALEEPAPAVNHVDFCLAVLGRLPGVDLEQQLRVGLELLGVTTVDSAQFRRLVASMLPTSQATQAALHADLDWDFRQADKDRDGQLSVDEYVEAARSNPTLVRHYVSLSKLVPTNQPPRRRFTS